MEDAGKKAYIGMGFAERSDSFDFSEYLVASRSTKLKFPHRRRDSGLYKVISPILPHQNKINRDFFNRRAKAALNPPSPTTETASAPAGPKKDYTLKEGQTFSISIPGRDKKVAAGSNLLGSNNGSLGFSMGGGIPLLPPPPSAPKRR